MGAALVIVLVALAAVPAAAAAPDPIEFTKLADATGPVQTDIRYAAWPTADGVVVLDTRTGGLSQHQPPTPLCRYRALGAAQLLWECGYDDWRDWPPRARVEHIPSRSIRTFEVRYGEQLDSIGRHWVHGLASDNHYSGVSHWVNIATSKTSSSSQRMARREVEDLDEPGLYRKLCAPLARDPSPYYEDTGTQRNGNPYLPYAYEPPYGLRHNGGQLTVDRCGSSDLVYLDGRARSSQLLGGWVTWVRGQRVNAFFPGRRQRFSWRFDQRDAATESKLFAAHTRSHVFVSTSPRAQPGTWRVFRARVRG